MTIDKPRGDSLHLFPKFFSDKRIGMESHETLIKVLQRIPWFLELSPSQIDALAKIASVRDMNAGDTIFNEGDAEDCMYVLLEGQAEATVHVPGRGNIPLFIAEPLDIIGWSVLTPVVRQRTATVKAVTDIHLVCLNSTILRQMCEQDRDFGFVIMRRIANIVASRLLVTRLQLFDLIRQTDGTTQENQHPV